nr:hypothetical protein [uncultured Desulfobacter sp.]
MKINTALKKIPVLAVLYIFIIADWAVADIPIISDIMVTDVTPSSFSVIWCASEPSTADLNIYIDENALFPAINAVTFPHPLGNKSASIQNAAEDNGVMKVMVTGLLPDTTYYFQTVTVSKTSGDIAHFPETTPLSSATTETKVVRSKVVAAEETTFSNDMILYDCYLPDNTTPADGTLLVVSVEGGHHAITRFVGDDVPAPYGYVDLNNLFDHITHENLPLNGGEILSLTQYMGIWGSVTEYFQVPENINLPELVFPDTLTTLLGDYNRDEDVDGEDLFKFAVQYNKKSNVIQLDVFAENYGR